VTTNYKDHLFHPLEISICGHSGSGKSTLIEKLIKKFSPSFNIGYIKHDSHKFEMDKKGKDTFRAKAAGATNMAISSPNSNAILSNNQNNKFIFRQNFVDSDIVFIEGYKKSLCHKILMWTDSDDDKTLLKQYLDDGKQNLLAIIGESEYAPVDSIRYFNRDNIDQIYTFIRDFWDKEISARPLYGLILSGGRSIRMGEDKSAISYHGNTQTTYLYNILAKFTQETYVSCRAEQKNNSHLSPYPNIDDRFVGFGPTGGILSAFQKHPNAAWLVVACDMPFISSEAIFDLIKRRNPYKLATCFLNEEKNWPEPLCAIYEPKAALKLGQFLAMGKPCPRKVLMNSNIQSLRAVDQKILGNVNTMDEFKIARSQIQAMGMNDEN